MSDRASTQGERIKIARKGSGLTQKQLGERSGGITDGSVSQWENNLTIPTAKNLFQISDVTGYSARWLSSADGPRLEAAAALELLSQDSDIAEKLKDQPAASISKLLKQLIDLI